MTISDTCPMPDSRLNLKQPYSRKPLISSNISEDKTLSCKQDICILDDGIRLLKEGGKIYIFRYR
jgi:hypothetical protein